mgnify:FL=1
MKSFHEILTGLETPATFYFVRHGESEGNVAGKMQGHHDHGLTDLGRRQARSTGEWFAQSSLPVHRVFSSPLSRARETAELLTSIAGYPSPEDLPAAKELHTGLFTGLSFPEIQERYPDEYAEFIVGSWQSVPDAETVQSLSQRALETWIQVVSAANDHARSANDGEAVRIMTLTHGGMLQWIFKASFGATPESPHPWMPLVLASNCAIFEFTARPVRSRDRTGTPTSWYYGQWSRVNFAPADESSPGAVAREQFHTGGDQAR